MFLMKNKVKIYQKELKRNQRTGVVSFNLDEMIAEDIGNILSDDFENKEKHHG